MLFKREFTIPLIKMIWFVFTFPALWLLNSLLLVFSPSFFDLKYSSENEKYIIKRDNALKNKYSDVEKIYAVVSNGYMEEKELPKIDFLFNHFIAEGMIALGCLLTDLLLFIGTGYILWN